MGTEKVDGTKIAFDIEGNRNEMKEQGKHWDLCGREGREETNRVMETAEGYRQQ